MYEWRNPGGGFSAAAPPSRTRVFLAIGVTVLVTVLALGAFVGWVVHRSNARYAEFMQGCLQDHKKYECTAMWRAGDKNDIPIMVPIPIPYSK
jgi:hypothetical protein